MLRHSFWVYAIDVFALFVGALIALPFVLIVLAPFIGA